MTTAPPRLHYPHLWQAIGWTLLALVVYLSLTANPPELLTFALADKLEHLLAYGVLMGWFGQLYPRHRQQTLWVLGLCAMGVGLEFMQGWSGARHFDTGDMLANALGVLLGWWLTRHWFAGLLQRLDYALHRP